MDKSKAEDGDHYMAVYERFGIKLLAGKEELKGQKFLAKGFLREDQCMELTNLARVSFSCVVDITIIFSAPAL